MTNCAKKRRNAETPKGRDRGSLFRCFGVSTFRRFVFAAVVLAYRDAGAQVSTSGSPADPFTATVALSDSIPRITLLQDRSVVIETNKPIERAQSIAADIAFVQVISPTRLLISAVSFGTTYVTGWDETGEQFLFQVTVELDTERLNAGLRELDPLSDAQATSVQGHIVLSGTVSGAETAEKMVGLAELFIPRQAASPGVTVVQNQLQVAGEQQVMLRCTVAEVSRSAVRELGINGFMGGQNVRDMFVVNQLNGINPINFQVAEGVDLMSPLPFITGAAPINSSTTLSLGFPRGQLQFFLHALAENSLLRVLAEPNLVAVSGETASFLAGGEFPIPVPQAGSAAGAVTIEFREFGVRLNFTPVAKGNGLIRLHIAPEISNTDFSNAVQIQGFLIPGLTQRRSETTVEVGSGQTLTIAGLLDDEVRGVISRVPGIGDVPVLGALFRSVEYRKELTELVILVTPEIVAPMNPNQVPPVPGQFLTDPNDFELYALGLVEGPRAPEGGLAGGPDGSPGPGPVSTDPEDPSVHGPWGYSTAADLR